MTIHRSKGLEFPVVLLADASHGFNLRDTSDPVLFHPQLGSGMCLRAAGGLYATAPHRAISLTQRAASVSEEMRVLYVALTRARDKLIVTAPIENAEKRLSALAFRLQGVGGADAYTFGQARSFSDWLCAVALMHPDCGALRRQVCAANLPLFSAHGHMNAFICTPHAAADRTQHPQTLSFRRTAQPDAALCARLAENFASRYPNAPLCTLPAKLSVSEIAHGGLTPTLARPAFAGREAMSAAERGTAMHAVLQFIDLTRAEQDLDAELTRLTEGLWLDAARVGQLDRAQLVSFLKSGLAGRMRGAQKLLREYAFFTAVPARFVQADIPAAFGHTPVQVQGIADAVLINGEEAEIADYKTDRVRDPQTLAATYQKQLFLYKSAIEKRLRVRVTRCTIYSLVHACEVDVPLASVREVPLS